LLRPTQRLVGAWMFSCRAMCARHRLQQQQQQLSGLVMRECSAATPCANATGCSSSSRAG
jgi:hypothetical protein